jgi:nucleotide-binding universal stress UspA family protein
MITNDPIDPCDGRAGVLIATNAGPAGVVTMRMGLALAQQWRVPATLVTVAPSDIAKIKERLAALAGEEHTIPVYEVRGAIGPAIAAAAETWGAALVVIGFGTGDHRLAADIVRHARRSVLVVSPSELGSIGRVMLTADFGGSTIEADQCALSLLESDGQAELIHVTPALQLAPDIYQAWRRAYDCAATELLDRTRAALPRRSGLSIPSRVAVGDAARVLVDIARRERVDLIALGRHARPNAGLGPVVELVLAQAPCSVLVAP